MRVEKKTPTPQLESLHTKILQFPVTLTTQESTVREENKSEFGTNSNWA